MRSLSRPALAAAALGGLFWTVKALVITANDGSFDPLESWMFIGGLLALIVAAVLIAIDLTRPLGGPLRIGAIVVTAAGLVLLSSLVEAAGKTLVAALASGDNLGLEQEGGILCAGLAWLLIGVSALTAAQRSARSG